MEIKKFCHSSHFIVSPPKMYIYREEYPIMPQSAVFYIQKGSVLLMKKLSKKVSHSKIVEAGSFFGMTELFLQMEDRLFSTLTMEKVELYYWSNVEFSNLLTSDAEFANLLTASLSNLLRTVSEKLNEIKYKKKQMKIKNKIK